KEKKRRGEDLSEALHVLPSMIGGSAQRLEHGDSRVCQTEPNRTLPLCGSARELYRYAPHRKQEVKGAIGGPTRGTRGCEIRKTQEIAGKETEETSQTAAARAQGKIPRAYVPSKSHTAPQAL